MAVLDELTTGLDPQARRDAWDLIEGIRARGVTIVLVTHFMEEAERLCDRLAVIDSGGSSRSTRRPGWSSTVDDRSGSGSGRPRRIDHALLTGLPEVIGGRAGGQPARGHRHREPAARRDHVLARNQVVAADLRVEQTTLDDAFVALTGRKIDSLRRPPCTPCPGSPLTEIKLFLREPAAVFFMLVFPPMLLVIFGLIPAFREPTDLGGLRVINLYAPIIIAMALALLALSALPQTFATYRELFRAVEAAAQGQAVLSPAVATRLMGQMRQPSSEPLSQRELEVLELIARGSTNREAAAQLFISEATVKTHLLHVYAKLGVNDRAAAVATAFNRGFLTPRS